MQLVMYSGIHCKSQGFICLYFCSCFQCSALLLNFCSLRFIFLHCFSLPLRKPDSWKITSWIFLFLVSCTTEYKRGFFQVWCVRYWFCSIVYWQNWSCVSLPFPPPLWNAVLKRLWNFLLKTSRDIFNTSSLPWTKTERAFWINCD